MCKDMKPQEKTGTFRKAGEAGLGGRAGATIQGSGCHAKHLDGEPLEVFSFKEQLFWWVSEQLDGKPERTAAGGPVRRDQEAPHPESEAGMDGRETAGPTRPGYSQCRLSSTFRCFTLPCCFLLFSRGTCFSAERCAELGRMDSPPLVAGTLVNSGLSTHDCFPFA